MPDWWRVWQSDARRNLKKNRQFLLRLSRFRLDMHRLEDVHQQVFAHVDCLQCGNCCKTAHPIFTRTDIDRIAGHLRIKPGELENQYLKADAEGDWVPQTFPCPFLESDNQCRVYDVRPKSCRSFPHTDKKEGWERPELLAKNTLTCPAAFRIVEILQKAVNQT